MMRNLFRKIRENLNLVDSNYLELSEEAFKDTSNFISHLEDTDAEGNFFWMVADWTPITKIDLTDGYYCLGG